jgi:hypothetical protein
MTTASPALPPLPAPNEPILLPGGLINPVWYDWLKMLERIVKQLREEV